MSESELKQQIDVSKDSKQTSKILHQATYKEQKKNQHPYNKKNLTKNIKISRSTIFPQQRTATISEESEDSLKEFNSDNDTKYHNNELTNKTYPKSNSHGVFTDQTMSLIIYMNSLSGNDCIKPNFKKILRILIKEFLFARSDNKYSIINEYNIYITKRFQILKYSINNTAPGVRGQDFSALKLVLNDMIGHMKSQKLKILTEYEMEILQHFSEMVKNITAETVIKLLKHPLISTMTDKLSDICYFYESIKSVDELKSVSILNTEKYNISIQVLKTNEINKIIKLLKIFEKKYHYLIKAEKGYITFSSKSFPMKKKDGTSCYNYDPHLTSSDHKNGHLVIELLRNIRNMVS